PPDRRREPERRRALDRRRRQPRGQRRGPDAAPRSLLRSLARQRRGAPDVRVGCRGARRAMITEEVVREHNLSPQEYAGILEILGREPNLVELGIFSAMWSEHCSYKSS